MWDQGHHRVARPTPPARSAVCSPAGRAVVFVDTRPPQARSAGRADERVGDVIARRRRRRRGLVEATGRWPGDRMVLALVKRCGHGRRGPGAELGRANRAPAIPRCSWSTRSTGWAATASSPSDGCPASWTPLTPDRREPVPVEYFRCPHRRHGVASSSTHSSTSCPGPATTRGMSRTWPSVLVADLVREELLIGCPTNCRTRSLPVTEWSARVRCRSCRARQQKAS